ncbi:hypothetical protein [Peribacillus butanolivorans]
MFGPSMKAVSLLADEFTSKLVKFTSKGTKFTSKVEFDPIL